MAQRQPHLQLVSLSQTEAPLLEPVDFNVLFEKYAGYVAGIAARLLGRDDHEVDDVVQDVFSLAWRRLDRIHHLEAARPWLVTVTVRTVGRRLRRRRWRASFMGEPTHSDIPSFAASPERRAMLVRVYRVLDTLNAEERIAWLLRHVEGELLEDVALACRCSLATAKRRIAAAEKVLREALGDG